MTTPIYFGNRSVTTTGNVGVGTTNPSSYNLQVVGTFGTTGDITAYYSDDRLKTRTGEITDALAKVKSLEGFIYRPNELATSFGFENGQHVGVSAQAVQRVLPEAIRPAPFDTDTVQGVKVSKTGQGYLTVQYDKLVPLLIEALKELESRVAQLEAERPPQS